MTRDNILDSIVACIMPGMFVLAGLVMWYQERYHPNPEFVYQRTNAGVSGTIDLTIPPEEQQYHYEYIERERNPCPLSGHSNCPGWVYPGVALKVYAVKLGKDDGDGYVGMVVREGVRVSDGERVKCGFRKLFYPRPDKSHYAFWMECQRQGEGKPIPPVHYCTAEKGGWVEKCPDFDQITHKPKLVYQY